MLYRCLFAAFVLFFTCSDTLAQDLAKKLDPGLKMLVTAVRMGGKNRALTKATGADRPLVHVYIQGQPAGVRSAVLGAGGRIGTVVGNMATAGVSPGAVGEVAAHPAVERMEKIAKKSVKNDNAAVHVGVSAVHRGAAPLSRAYTGRGVVVGVIDTGIDYRHPDFRDPQDSTKTRILSLWDQEDKGGPAADGFFYGTVWSKADIEATLAGRDIVRQQDAEGHGTHVAGTAAGNGAALGAYRGMAPDADIIFVKGLNNCIDAASYIFDEAKKLGRPAVVNYSVGSHYGPHDGTSMEAVMLDELIAAAPGRVFVAAAGNEGDKFLHWGGFDLGPDSVWTYYHKDIFFTEVLEDDTVGYIGGMEISGTVFNTDAENTYLAVGVDTTEYVELFVKPLGYHGQTPWHSLKELADLGDALTDTVRYMNGEVAGVVVFSAYAQDNGKVMFGFSISDFMSLVDLSAGESAVGADLWRFMARGSGEIHAWSETVLSAEHRDVGLSITDDRYRPADNRASVTIPATAKNVIAAGSYVSVELGDASAAAGSLTSCSSRGPTVDGRIKPDIAAPGDNVTSALSGWATSVGLTQAGLYQVLSGTSMASPVVAGSVALYLQQNPNASHTDVLRAIITHAETDAFTDASGILPNNDWGHGKLNLFAAMTGGARPPAVGEISPGETAEGRLAGVNGRTAYLLALDSITEIVLDLTPGSNLDPVLDIFKGMSLSDTLEENRVGDRIDVGGSGEAERFEGKLEAGRYLIVLSPYEVGSTGDFTLHVSGSDGSTAGPVIPEDPVEASDFNGDGIVNFNDFVSFAQNFGKGPDNEDFNSRFDLDENGAVGFSDFVLFSQSFGKQVGASKPGRDTGT